MRIGNRSSVKLYLANQSAAKRPDNGGHKNISVVNVDSDNKRGGTFDAFQNSNTNPFEANLMDNKGIF